MHKMSPALTSREIAEVLKRPPALISSQIFGMLEYDLALDPADFEFVYRTTPNRELKEFRLGRKLTRHFISTKYPTLMVKVMRRLNASEMEMPDVPAVEFDAPEQPLQLEWTGEPFFLIGDYGFPPREFKHWIVGDESTIKHAMRQAGLMTAKWQPTAKGKPLIAGKRCGEYLFKARSTLQALGVWR